MGLRRFLKKVAINKFVAQEHVKQTFDTASKSDVPVLIIAFNNGVYVKSMVEQLCRYGIFPLIIDNASTQKETVHIIAKLVANGSAISVRCPMNFGHDVIFMTQIYNLLPPIFACTDPDLLFSKKLPHDFLAQLADISDKYNVFKVGMALSLDGSVIDLSHEVKTKRPLEFRKKFSIKEWESQFWRFRIVSEKKYEIYAAPIDTTFFVCSKKYFNGRLLDGIRVAGDFACVHMPWFVDLDIMNDVDKDVYYKTKNSTSGVWVK